MRLGRAWFVLVIGTGLFALGCGGDDEASVDAAGDDAAATLDAAAVPDAAVPDAAPPDAFVCPPPAFGAIGGACDSDLDCGSGAFCLDEDDGDGDGPSFPATGYCTKGCTLDVECGDGASCSAVIGGGVAPGGGGPGRLCFPDCCAGNVCGTGYLCQDALFGFLDLGIDVCLPGDGAAGDGDPCVSFADCNVGSMCQNNPFQAPDGVCVTLGCTVGDNDTCAPGGDGVCLLLGDTPGCLDSCDATADCRDDEGYECVDIGGGTEFCWYPTADLGDPCAIATDCGPAPWECLTGADFPNGYCSADDCLPADPSTCPFDAICYDPGGGDKLFCALSCDLGDPDCPTDYTCTDVGGGDAACIVP